MDKYSDEIAYWERVDARVDTLEGDCTAQRHLRRLRALQRQELADQNRVGTLSPTQWTILIAVAIGGLLFGFLAVAFCAVG